MGRSKVNYTVKKIIKKIPGSSYLYRKLTELPSRFTFRRDFEEFKKKSDPCRFPIRWSDRYPCLADRFPLTPFDRHYIYHTAWAARVLTKIHPKEHVDISSSLYFVTSVSAFVPVRFYDYRPVDLKLSGLSSNFADLTALPFQNNSIVSLSCMHVVEHIGLGRYGDPLDPDGDLKAMAQLQRVLRRGGDLLFVVPIGKPKVMFNAHRIYSYDQILQAFTPLKVREFSLIPDDPAQGGLIQNATQQLADQQEYGCGCFWLQKP